MNLLPDDIDFTKFIGRQESQNISPAHAFRDDLLSRIRGEESLQGLPLPWEKTRGKVALRTSEVSIWAGINGHGKSLLTGYVVSWLLLETKCLVASLEMKPAATLYRMVRQVSGTSAPSEEFASYFSEWTNDRLWLYDQTDTVPAKRILGVCWYAAQELGVKHIVIDSLMKCGIGDQGEHAYNQQKFFLDKLSWAAKALDVHIHLVHHVRKGQSETDTPDKFDLKGSGSISDLADNVFIVHRNKKKEERERELILEDDDSRLEKQKKDLEVWPDASVIVAKQRNGEWEGKIGLYFDTASMAFSGSLKGDSPHPLARQFDNRYAPKR